MTPKQSNDDEQPRSIFNDLFAPVSRDKVLIPGEKTFYDERRHWAILLPPGIETFIGIGVVLTMAPGVSLAALLGPVANIFGGLLVIGALIMFRRRYRFSKKRARIAVLRLVAAVVITVAIFRAAAPAVLILLALGFFAYRFLFWRHYERLYISNRRIILAQAFLGSKISTMPLARVTDLSYQTTVPADILGYAVLRVESAGQEQALSRIRFLYEPERFYDQIIQLTTGEAGSEMQEEQLRQQKMGM